jgi:hypothetical protein
MSDNLGPIIGLVCGGFFILAFAGLGAFLIYKSVRNRKKADASQSWPATSGQITAAHVSHHTSTDSDGDSSDYYTPKVSYTYQALGQEYQGDKIGFGFQVSYGSPGKAQAILASFPVGGQVAVYYDPNNPAESVLERKAGGSTLTLVLGIIFIAVSLCVGCPGLVVLVLAPWSSAQ